MLDRARIRHKPNKKVICDVCKLHEHQAGEAAVILEHPGVDMMPISESSLEGRGGAGGRKLYDVQSVDEHERSPQRGSSSNRRAIVILGRRYEVSDIDSSLYMRMTDTLSRFLFLCLRTTMYRQGTE
ncbi:hypothetical protein BDQ17DRAFT_1031642 [Cyathus striatus]|nr:hypothetical protein BDQ17DRAFT_1031642 [Cyathus striatus]